MMLFLGGSYFAYRNYKQNRPHSMWVPLPIRADLEMAKRDQIIKDLKAKLSTPEILLQVSKDMGLSAKWNLPSDEECAQELGRRLFVRPGDAETPAGKVPAIHIGVSGKLKDSEISGQIAMRLMDDVRDILGIKLPAKSDS